MLSHPFHIPVHPHPHPRVTKATIPSNMRPVEIRALPRCAPYDAKTMLYIIYLLLFHPVCRVITDIINVCVNERWSINMRRSTIGIYVYGDKTFSLFLSAPIVIESSSNLEPIQMTHIGNI